MTIQTQRELQAAIKANADQLNAAIDQSWDEVIGELTTRQREFMCGFAGVPVAQFREMSRPDQAEVLLVVIKWGKLAHKIAAKFAHKRDAAHRPIIEQGWRATA